MLSRQDVLKAYQVIRPVTNRTPLDHSRTFSTMTGNHVYLKLENLQKTGSFKIRGAYYKLSTLSPQEKKRGVIAASAGNHAQGVAYGSRLAGIKSFVVMPKNAPLAKIEASQNYGAQVILYGKSFDEAHMYALKLQGKLGASFIHAFDDPFVIAGQGTVGLEVLEDLPEVEGLMVPVGGGGLISGIALAVKETHPHLKLIGVQAERCPSMLLSLKSGERQTVPHQETVADGIAVKRPGALTFEIISRYVDELVTVKEKEITQTMLYLLERSKQVVEGAGAAALAALLFGKTKLVNKKVAVIISGGNVDLAKLPLWLSRSITLPNKIKGKKADQNDQPNESAAQTIPMAVSRLDGAHQHISK